VIDIEPLPASIGLCTVNGFAGPLIDLGERLLGYHDSEFRHAFLVLPNGMLFEAQPGGARIVPLSTYADRKVTYVSPPGLTDEQRLAVCAAAEKYVGVGYSAAEYFALAAHRFHVPAPGLREYIASSHRMICSQAVDQCFRDEEIHLFRDRWPGYVVPPDYWVAFGAEGGER
jgi:hypothetical protein